MSNGGDRFVKTGGGVAATHPRRRLQPVLVAPDTTGEVNTIQEEILPVACVRLDDVRFEFDSSIVGPAVSDELKELSRLRRDVPGMPLSVFGHADPTGDDTYNKTLSGRRAQAVYGLLTRKIELWEDLYKHPLGGDKWEYKATQVMLTKLGHYAGDAHGRLDTATADAVEAFQRSPAGAGLNPDRDPGPLTREKLFLAYMNAICVDDSGQSFQLDPVADFIAHGADAKGKGDYQGCSEFNPTLVFSQADDRRFQDPANHEERNERNLINRRVLIFLFRPGFGIRPDNWPCPRAKEGSQGCRDRFFGRGEGDRRRKPQADEREYKDTQNTFACRFYDRLAQESPCELGGPPVQSHLFVALRLQWEDPLGTAHDFPVGFPVSVTPAVGAALLPAVAAGGLLEFILPRNAESFTLTFETSARSYIGSAPAGGTLSPAERHIPEAEVDAAIEQGYQVFLLPAASWTLRDADWTAPAGTAFANGVFLGIETLGNTLGTPAAPTLLLLKPRWQFFKFTYFDRVLKSRLAILQTMINGYNDVDTAGVAPDSLDVAIDPHTRSNWRIEQPQVAQCLPWILKDPPTPNAKILIELTTPDLTYIESSADGTRRVVSGTRHETPGAERLRFYDLPEQWLSRGYFARRTDRTGGAFEDLATEGRTAAAPLEFSLDDMVLTDELRDALPWDPAQDRVAIFSHTFAAGTNLSSLGVYKPDRPTNAEPHVGPYYSQRVDQLTSRNYIADYPDWTRLVIFNGNLHDVFALRTSGARGTPVGARAAVRWVDATRPANVWVPPSPPPGSFTQAPAGTIASPGRMVDPRPRPTRGHLAGLPAPGAASLTNLGEYCVVQPFYEQRHHRWWESADGTRGIGRCDLALLRCCDVDGDVEIALNVQYFRFFFEFPATANPERKSTPTTMTEGQRRAFGRATAQNIPDRWNGADAWGVRIRITPEDANVKLRVRPFWFVQATPRPVAHFAFQVYKEVRAAMGSDDGESFLAEGGQRPTSDGTFVAAHETGHGGSMGDEYVESSTKASCSQLGFWSFSPGAPYVRDDGDSGGMMKEDVQQARGRHFWHNAEWLRSLLGTAFEVKVGDRFTYKIRQHANAPRRSHVNWPIDERANARGPAATNNGRGNFDLFLYPLGHDHFSQFKLSAPRQFDAMLVLVVKMLFHFDTDSHDKMSRFLSRIDRSLRLKFQDNLAVRAVGTDFTSCWIHITPRYLVRTFADDDDYNARVDLPIRDPASGDIDTLTLAQYMTNRSLTNKKNAFQAMVDDAALLEPPHYTVRVHDKVFTDIHWQTGSPASRDLRFEYDKDDEFWKYFCEMLGLNNGQMPSETNFGGVASVLLNGGRADRLR